MVQTVARLTEVKEQVKLTKEQVQAIIEGMEKTISRATIAKLSSIKRSRLICQKALRANSSLEFQGRFFYLTSTGLTTPRSLSVYLGSMLK